MARPQNSPRGNFGKHRVEIGAADGLYFNDYSSSTALIDANSTGLKLAGALYLSGKATDPITQNTTAVLFSDGIALSGQGSTNAITQNSTAVMIPDGIRLDGKKYIRANSTAYLFTTAGGLPATDGGAYKWTFIVNSTGIGSIAVNTTGTTWKYIRVTSLINTT